MNNILEWNLTDKTEKWRTFLNDAMYSAGKIHSVEWNDIIAFISSEFNATLIKTHGYYLYTENDVTSVSIKFESEEYKIEFVLRYL